MRARLRATVLVLVLVVACSDATITRIPADPDEVDEGLDGIDELADADPDPDGIDSADADPDLIDPEGDDPDGDDTVIDPDADELLVDADGEDDADPDREPDPGCGPGLEGTPCNDGKGCTVRDTCRADGSCTGDPACPAATECSQAAACDEVQGCRPAVPLRQGLECTTREQRRGRCNQGVCATCVCGPDVTVCCPDGCSYSGTDNDPCDDGNPRTYDDKCDFGRCISVRPCGCDTPSTCCDGCKVIDCRGDNDRCVQGECRKSPEIGTCQPCTAGWECARGGCIVMPGRTRALCGGMPCQNDEQCKNSIFGAANSNPICVEGFCGYAAISGADLNAFCCEPSDCADGRQCWTARCLPRCTTDRECGSSARCNAGQCERVR